MAEVPDPNKAKTIMRGVASDEIFMLCFFILVTSFWSGLNYDSLRWEAQLAAPSFHVSPLSPNNSCRINALRRPICRGEWR